MENDVKFQLGEHPREVLGAFVDTVIHRAVEIDSKPALEEVVDEIEDYIGNLPSLYRWGIKVLVRLIEMGPLAWGYRHQFSNLEQEERLNFLSEFEIHGNYAPRAMVLALKSLVLMVYFSIPSIEQGVGYDHLCLVEARSSAGRE